MSEKDFLDNPLVSIIVPVYNSEKYLEKCLDSIIKQSYYNIEVIIIDDGSNDNSPHICDKYAEKDNRISVYHTRNQGSVMARKKGVELSKGEFLQFVDSDDWLSSDMTKNLVENSVKYQSELVICSFYLVESQIRISDNYYKEGFYDKNRIDSIIRPSMLYNGKYYNQGVYSCLWSKLFRKNKFINYIMSIPNEISLGDDTACLFPYMCNINSLFILNKPLYFYRINDYSMTNSYNCRQLESTFVLIDYLKYKFKNNQFNIKRQFNYYILFILEMNIKNTIRYGFSRGFYMEWKKIKKYINKYDIKEILNNTDLKDTSKVNWYYFRIVSSHFFNFFMTYAIIKNKIIRSS